MNVYENHGLLVSTHIRVPLLLLQMHAHCCYKLIALCVLLINPYDRLNRWALTALLLKYNMVYAPQEMMEWSYNFLNDSDCFCELLTTELRCSVENACVEVRKSSQRFSSSQTHVLFVGRVGQVP